MKKILFMLLVIVPCLCLAQENEKSNKVKRVAGHIEINTTVPPEEFWINCGCSDKSKNEPLILIDGVKGDINKLNPEEIESFKVLKEAGEIEAYGEEGKNGVILITTIEFAKKNKKEEYEVQVFSPGYEGFLATQKSKDFYTESFLKAKNMLMVSEWNQRYRQPGHYDSNIYEVSIDYDSKTDYGLDVEYGLYMFFRFMEKEHNMSLIGDRLTAKL